MDEGKIHVSQDLLPTVMPDAHFDDEGCGCVNCRITRVEVRLSSVESKLTLILGVMERTEQVINRVAAEVMPTIEALASNPMIKALGFKSKGK